MDASLVTTSIDDAISAAQAPVTPEADTAGITTSIDDAVAGATPPAVPVETDSSAISDSIDTAVSGAQPPPLEVPVDTEAIGGSIDEALAGVDTSPLTDQLNSLTTGETSAGGAAKGLGENIGLIAPSAALATGELGASRDVLTQITPAAAGAVGAVGGLVLAGKDLFSQALEQNTALTRLRDTYGSLASQVEHVNFGGINEDLATLAVRTGADVDGLRNFAASFGVLGQSAGDTKQHVADVSQQVILLAERASVLNPNLGTADEIVQRLSTSLSRGGRFLAAYGISLSTAQIQAEALRETGKASVSDLSLYDKAVAGATLATQQLGGSLGTDINNGAQKAQVQLRALKAAFDETLKAAGAPLITPTIDAFRQLEPVLESLARLLGTTLAAALHLVGPLLSGLAAVLTPIANIVSSIPQPVLEAALAFLAFRTVGPILADVVRAAESFAVGLVRGMTTAEVGTLAAVGVITAGIGFLIFNLQQQNAAAKSFADTFAKNIGGVSADTLPQLTRKIGELRDAQGGYLNSIKLLGPFQESASEKAEKEADALQKLVDQAQQAAHTQLTAAVASGELSRQEEVAAIKANTAKDGHVNWLAVLKELQPTIDQNTNKTDAYGNALDKNTEATKTNANAQQDLAQLQLSQLTTSGQFTQAQIDQAVALSRSKDGTNDYAGALKLLDPAMAAVVADQVTIANGLDTQATRFQLAKDQAALYKEQFDQLVQPQLDADTAAGKFRDTLRDETSWFGVAAANAKAYADTISAIVDPTLSVNEANIKLQDQIDKTNQALAANKGATDERIKAGRDDEQAVIDLVRAYDTEIEALIKSGESAKVVSDERQNEISKLEDLKAHYPGLTQSVDEYIARLKEANTSGQEASRVEDAHRQALNDVITAGEKWTETLIASGAKEQDVAAARQEEIDKLTALKQQFPELGPVIDGYIAKLQGIPPEKTTLINLPNTIQNEIDLANIHQAINELHDKGVAITVDSVQAQIQADAAKQHIDNATQPVPTVGINVSVNEGGLPSLIDGLAFMLQHPDINVNANVQTHGTQAVAQIVNPGAMAGGTFAPWQSVLVGEQGPEVVTFPQDFTVTPHGQEPQQQGGKLFENLIVNEVAQDPQATANSVAARLGRVAKR